MSVGGGSERRWRDTTEQELINYEHITNAPDSEKVNVDSLSEHWFLYFIYDTKDPGAELQAEYCISDDDPGETFGNRYVTSWGVDMPLEDFDEQLYESGLVDDPSITASAQTFEGQELGSAPVEGKYAFVTQAPEFPQEVATFKIGEQGDPYQLRWTKEETRTGHDHHIRLVVSGDEPDLFENIYPDFSYHRNQDLFMKRIRMGTNAHY